MDYQRIEKAINNCKIDSTKIKNDLDKYGFIIRNVGYHARTLKNKETYILLDNFYDTGLNEDDKKTLYDIDIDTLKMNAFSIYFIIPDNDKLKDKTSFQYVSRQLNNYLIDNHFANDKETALFITYGHEGRDVNMTYVESRRYFQIRCLDTIEQAKNLCNTLKTILEWNDDSMSIDLVEI